MSISMMTMIVPLLMNEMKGEMILLMKEVQELKSNLLLRPSTLLKTIILLEIVLKTMKAV
jgi:hypothetical protein